MGAHYAEQTSLLWPLQDITELARCLRRGETLENAARILRRDEVQVRQKAYDLGAG
jgi:hypothetical protein